MVLQTSLHWLRQNLNQSLESEKTPHASPWRASYGVSLVEILGENLPRYNGTALYYPCWFSSMITLRTKCCNFYLWWLKKDPPRDVYDKWHCWTWCRITQAIIWWTDSLWMRTPAEVFVVFVGVTWALRSAHRPRSPNKNFWVLIQYKNAVLPCVENPILWIRQ